MVRINQQLLKDDCEIIGVRFENLDTLTIKEVIRAYRRKALKIHPDKVDESKKESAITHEICMQRECQSAVERADPVRGLGA